jgi:hypothetical protein
MYGNAWIKYHIPNSPGSAPKQILQRLKNMNPTLHAKLFAAMKVKVTRRFERSPPPLIQENANDGVAPVTKNSGPWTTKEHHIYLQGVASHGKNKHAKIASVVKTQHRCQVRTH